MKVKEAKVKIKHVGEDPFIDEKENTQIIPQFDILKKSMIYATNHRLEIQAKETEIIFDIKK